MESVSLFTSFIKMIFALAVVLGILIAAMYFFKKFMQHSSPANNNQAAINIISSKYLGPKNSIVLVEVLDQIIVVGISAQQMNTLACIDDPLAVERLRTKMPAAGGLDILGEKINKYKAMLNLSSARGKDKTKQ